jgi:hypothetical protein
MFERVITCVLDKKKPCRPDRLRLKALKSTVQGAAL